MTIQFDNEGFALESGYITVYVVDEQGVFTHSEEQFISVGCGLAANAVLEKPKPAKQGYAVQWHGNGWQYVADHRGQTVYSTTDKTPLTINELGEIPQGYTELAPTCVNCEWNGTAWAVRPERLAEIKAEKQAQMRAKINAKRDEVDAGGVFIPQINKWIDSDDKAYQNIFGVKSTLDLLGEMEIPWTWADNSISPINRDTLKVIVGTLLQTKQANHANAIAHKQAMMLLDNPEDYDYSAGWAQTYADHLAEVANG